MDVLGGIAETFGLGELVRGVLGGASTYAEGRSTQSGSAGGDAAGPYVYERVLTRPRTQNINDR